MVGAYSELLPRIRFVLRRGPRLSGASPDGYKPLMSAGPEPSNTHWKPVLAGPLQALELLEPCPGQRRPVMAQPSEEG